jgi:uncharacterized protein (TIGR00730 family)
MLLAWSFDEYLWRLPDVMQIFLAIWLFAVGSCVGSFINVVALRLPAGMSIARSGSRCPVCLHGIRWHDNVPLLGWLLLRGRCRDCGTWISVRYPLVELLTGLLFLTLGMGEGLIAGRNLPRPPAAAPWFHLAPQQYWSLYAYHIVVLVTLLTAALIQFDRKRVPRQVFFPALVAGLASPLFLPWLHPIPVCSLAEAPAWFLGASNALWGLLAGGVMGACIAPVARRSLQERWWERPEWWAAALCGLFLGWQAVGGVVLAAAVGYGAVVTISRFRPHWGAGPWCGYLTLAGLLYIIQWRHLVEQFPALGTCGNAGVAGLLALSAGGLSLVTARWVRHPRAAALAATRPSGQGEIMTPADSHEKLKAILASPSYLPVEYDAHFLQQPELRAVRVQLELLKPELGFSREGVNSTIVVFGGTQIFEAAAAQTELDRARAALAEAPADAQRQRAVRRAERIVAKAPYYEAARAFAQLVSQKCQIEGQRNYVIVTGGGPGIMEAANRGAYEVGAKSIGLNITLPLEQMPNPYITPNLCFQFHYFAMRKMHFLMRAKALVVFPGGFGTLDELFDALTLRQTQRMQEIPIILFGRAYWNHVIDFQFLADEGVIADQHLDLISYAETPEEAWNVIAQFHRHA